MLRFWPLLVIATAISIAAAACVEEVSRDNPGQLPSGPTGQQISPAESALDSTAHDDSTLPSDPEDTSESLFPKTSEPLDIAAAPNDQRIESSPHVETPRAIGSSAESANLPPQLEPGPGPETGGPLTTIPTSIPQLVQPTPTQELIRVLPVLKSTRAVEVDPSQFRQMIPRDVIEPVYEPRFVSAEQASLQANELVIGVEINGESRAYPVGPLNQREIVNDIVGGVPILVTW